MEDNLKYIVVEAVSIEKLAIAVSNKMDKGYAPHGSLQTMAYPSDHGTTKGSTATFLQPMVKVWPA